MDIQMGIIQGIVLVGAGSDLSERSRIDYLSTSEG
jgi:hypothetical protein